MQERLTAEDRVMLLESWQRFIDRAVRPVAERHRETLFPKAVVHEVLKGMRDFGMPGGWVRSEDGGGGLDYETSALLFEALAKASPDLAGALFITESATANIAEHGSEAVRRRYLPGLVDGALIASSGVTEPGVGSNPREIRTKGLIEDGIVRISGQKTWISNGGIADICNVVVRHSDGTLSRILVDRAEHGFTSQEMDKIGFKSWSTAELFFDDVAVPVENAIGPIGSALSLVLRSIQRGRLFVSLIAIAMAETAIEGAVDYATQRRQFGHPIAAFQLIQAKLAEMATLHRAARLLVYDGIAKLDRGEDCMVEASMAKWYATETAVQICSEAIQIHGAYGLSPEYPVERLFRNARSMTIPDGTTEINKLVIGRELTGVSAFAPPPQS